MNKPSLMRAAVAVAAGFVLASGLSASAQTLLYQDNFNTADGAIPGDLSRLTGLNASQVTPQSGGSGQLISGNQLSLTLAGGATTSEMRFGVTGNANTGAAPNLFDWSSGAGGTAITAAGGFTVSFLWTAGDTTSGNWIFFTLGNGGDISYNNLRIFSSTTENGIIFKNTGAQQIFNGGSSVTGGGSYTPVGTTHSVSITYSLTSWAPGSAVSMSAVVDGNAAGSSTFNLNGTSGQYFDIGTYGNNNNLIDNFTVTTLAPVPEPATWAMTAGGLGLLLITRRFRRA
jgi:hypothetical protein